MKMFPNNLEIKFWTSAALANQGKIKEAVPFFKKIFAKNKNRKDLTTRFLPNGLLKVDGKQLEQILN